jgi:hypothetical protein
MPQKDAEDPNRAETSWKDAVSPGARVDYATPVHDEAWYLQEFNLLTSFLRKWPHHQEELLRLMRQGTIMTDRLAFLTQKYHLLLWRIHEKEEAVLAFLEHMRAASSDGGSSLPLEVTRGHWTLCRHMPNPLRQALNLIYASVVHGDMWTLKSARAGTFS